jgi:hypothetical protein
MNDGLYKRWNLIVLVKYVLTEVALEPSYFCIFANVWQI